MKDILREAISEAEKIGRLRKPYYSQGYTHEEAVKAGEELLERTYKKLKNFISVNNCVSGELPNCIECYNQIGIGDKYCKHCGYEQDKKFGNFA